MYNKKNRTLHTVYTEIRDLTFKGYSNIFIQCFYIYSHLFKLYLANQKSLHIMHNINLVCNYLSTM